MEYTLQTFGSITPSTLGDTTSYLGIAVDKNMNGSPDLCVFVIYYREIRAEVTDCGTEFLHWSGVGQSALSTVSFEIPKRELGKTHYWWAFSHYEERSPCLRGCDDTVPNRRALVHDLVDPLVHWVSPSGFSTDRTLTMDLSLAFLATDDIGVVSWTIDDIYDPGVTLASGVSPTTDNVDTSITLQQGRQYALDIHAWDAQGNTDSLDRNEHLNVCTPFDDANPALTYTGSWSTASGDPSWFMGTRHTTSTVGDSVTLTLPTPVQAYYAYALGGPGNGSATIATDGGSATSTETSSTPKASVLVNSLFWQPNYTTQVTVTVTSGTFTLDGIVISGCQV